MCDYKIALKWIDTKGCKTPSTQNDSDFNISAWSNIDNSTFLEPSSLPDLQPISETCLAPSETSIISVRDVAIDITGCVSHRNTEVNHLHHSWNNFPSDISKSTLDLDIDNSELNFSHMNLSDTSQKDISEALSVSYEKETYMQHDTSSCNEHDISEVLKDMSPDISNQDATSVTYDANGISVLVDSEASMSVLEETPLISDGIATPNSSLLNEGSAEYDDDTTESDNENYIKDILIGVGYSPLIVENILSTSEKGKYVENGDAKSRPLTQVFTQGKVYTYDKLEFGNSGEKQAMPSRSRENVSTSNLGHKASTSSSKLNPEASPFMSRGTVGNNLTRLGHDALTILKNIRIENLKNVIIGQLNINSLGNKHHALVELLRGNLDILVITETKLDGTFPEKQFYIPGYKKPFRKDRNKNGGGVMIYVREDIPSDILMKHRIDENIEAIFVEINLRKNKLLLVGTYHSTNAKYGTTDEEYFRQMGLALDVYSSTYDKFLLAGDFNVKEENDTLDEFLEDYHAKNLVKEPTCFKNPENPSCIDLFITNSFQSFQKTTTVTTGLSDFHNMTVTVLKTTFPKASPRIISYRSPYEVEDLEKALIENLSKMETKSYESFEDMVMKSFDSVSVRKERAVRANEKPYVTKEMRKAIMRRSQLQKKVYYHGTEETTQAFNKQKNYCNRLYKRERRDFYNRLDLKKITDNIKFWDTMNPLFSDKGGMRQNSLDRRQ